ncbi:guanylate-binding protein 1-like [Pelodytes ibericus]
MAAVQPMTNPICLIENIAGKKMLVNPEAQKILEKISQPVVVVSIVGPYRSGKSYLINKLAGEAQGGFPVGDTVQAKTEGIWMGCIPHQHYTLVLLDTEGLGDAMKRSPQNDSDILSLSMLLSSTMIYNTRTVIDQDALEKLYKMSELSEYILNRSSKEEGEDVVSQWGLPLFVWAVRDFCLKVEIGSKPLSADEYLENSLKDITPVKSIKTQYQNSKRQFLRSMFPSRKCFLFGCLEKGESPGGEFVRKTEEFRCFIHEKSKMKTLEGGRPITGTMLAQLIHKYVAVVGSRDISILVEAASSLWFNLSEQEIKLAAEMYEEKMMSGSINTAREFQELHDSSMAESLQHLQRLGYKDPKTGLMEPEDRLKELVMSKKQEIWKRREYSSVKICKDLIQRLSQPLENRLNNKDYHIAGGHAKFVTDQSKIVSQYNRQGDKGIKADDVLQEFLKSFEDVEKIILQTDQQLSEKTNHMCNDPEDTKQLTNYILNYRLDNRDYDRVLIQVFGFVGHGKSSFVNSCLYTLSKKSFQDMAGESTPNMVKTMDRRGYHLTDVISVADNRGFVIMDSSVKRVLSAQLSNSVELNQYVFWEESQSLESETKDKISYIIVPVLIHSSKYTLSDTESKSLREFIAHAHKLTRILPFVVLTNEFSGNSESMKQTFRQMKVEQIYSWENYTVSDSVALRQTHLKILKFIYDVLQVVDFAYTG